MKLERIKKTGIVMTVIGGMLISLSACQNVSATDETSFTEPDTYTGIAMGTMISETIYSEGNNITGEILDKLTELENDILSWRSEESEISQMNAQAGTDVPVPLSDEMNDYMEQILQLAKDSNGAFDPTVGEVTRLWDIDGENPHIPKESEVKACLENVGYEKIKLTDNKVIAEEGVSIDLGAVGKGIGCDEAKKLLEEKAFGAVISVGGSILVYGSKPDESPWKVAITDPRNEEGYLGVLTLEGEHYISTSGDYEKYFEEDGVRYHHILDPATGNPARSGLISVTVVCDNGLLSDGLSTACFVLGMEESKNLLERYQAEAIFVDDENNVYMTDGMQEWFELTRESS